MSTGGKSLLIRADFTIGFGQDIERLVYRRWRRVWEEALPRLLGCARRCPRAEHICLHRGNEVGKYSAWLRIPVKRRLPSDLVHVLEKKLTDRLSAGLKPIQGQAIKLRIRRCHALAESLPLFARIQVN